MSTVTISSTTDCGSSPLNQVLLCREIVPGDEPSYEVCKIIYEFHPIGKKMVDAPISMAQCQPRVINIQKGPEDRCREAFLEEWKQINADRYIANVMRLSRIYGIASIAIKVEGQADDQPVDFRKLYGKEISFSVFDPLNTAGSLVLNLDPNAFDFLKTQGITVQGKKYDQSRTVVMMNEEPIYLSYTVSAFGFVGRSVYQRALYPLKSFIQTMITDDMITRKAGVIIAKMRTFGAIVDQVMQQAAALKRAILKEAQTDNVISINTEESIESLDLQNLDTPFALARKNILENIALSADMPAKILNAETFAEGFGEGSEDAKHIAQFVGRMRTTMQPLYDYFDKIVMFRAWNEDFYQQIQKEFPETYGKVAYEDAFIKWQNSFKANFPNLLEEPDSEKSKAEDVKLKAIIAMVEVLLPQMDPENKARVIEWACDNFNDFKLLFSAPLLLDFEAIATYTPPAQQAMMKPKAEAPFSSKDSELVVMPKLLRALNGAHGHS